MTQRTSIRLILKMIGTRHLVFTIVFCGIFGKGWCISCQDTGWEKVNGMRPISFSNDKNLYQAVRFSGIVRPCFNECKRINCTSFIIDSKENMCYSFKNYSDEFIPDPNSIFYHQICITVPKTCKQTRLWQVERTLGAILLNSSSTLWSSELITRNECYNKCLKSGKNCKSAQFRTIKPLSIHNAMGRCELSTVERETRPQSYTGSIYRDEYLETQCHNISEADYCSYAEFRNLSLPYFDVVLPGLDTKACESRCDLSIDGFICRAYTIDNSMQGESPICLLHSEDTTSLGVSSLVPTSYAIYKERESCLNIKVHCNETTMTVELITMEPFGGRLYANGYGDHCEVQGGGKNVTFLNLILPNKEDLRISKTKCGLTQAFSLDAENRTHSVIWATIVVQFNPIIQRLGDQAVRVGCSLDDLYLPEPRNVSVQSSFTFLDPNAGVPPIISTVMNTSSEVPVVTMRILDEDNKDAIVTRLGQKLILKIQITPNDGPYDIMAGHLIASSDSGDSSILLLDENGCPPDPTIFPPSLKDPMDSRSLSSRFTAFKFYGSQRVKFSVVVKFCMNECPPITCTGGLISYGRKRKRSINGLPTTQNSIAEVTEIFNNSSTPDELPLQLSIIVQSLVISADPLMSRQKSGPDTVLIAGENAIDKLLCMEASLALSLLIIWLIIQIALITGCLLVVGRYRRLAIQAEEERADILTRHLYGIHNGNFEITRRVRWADNNSSTLS